MNWSYLISLTGWAMNMPSGGTANTAVPPDSHADSHAEFSSKALSPRCQQCGDSRCHCFTSKRLTADQLPDVPEDELARTRHHILFVGSVLVVNCETVVF
jgi:hypothetical protein